MSFLWFISSRKEKTILLENIINILSISNEEKELYKLSLMVLEDEDFNLFFKKIQENFSQESKSIEPFSTKII